MIRGSAGELVERRRQRVTLRLARPSRSSSISTQAKRCHKKLMSLFLTRLIFIRLIRCHLARTTRSPRSWATMCSICLPAPDLGRAQKPFTAVDESGLFTVYKIAVERMDVSPNQEGASWFVCKRYSEFRALRDQLSSMSGKLSDTMKHASVAVLSRQASLSV